MHKSGLYPVKPIQTKDYLYIESPDVIRIKGHRIGPEHIIERFLLGNSPNQIAEEFPGLDIRVIYAVIAHYLWYQPEVDAYLTKLEDDSKAAYEEWKKTRTAMSIHIEEILKTRRADNQTIHENPLPV